MAAHLHNTRLCSYIRGKAVGEGDSAKNWQMIFLEVVVERQPTAMTGHDGRPVTTTIDLMRDEEGDDAAANPSAGSFGAHVASGRVSPDCHTAFAIIGMAR